jgi:hypothetical protein
MRKVCSRPSSRRSVTVVPKDAVSASTGGRLPRSRAAPASSELPALRRQRRIVPRDRFPMDFLEAGKGGLDRHETFG